MPVGCRQLEAICVNVQAPSIAFSPVTRGLQLQDLLTNFASDGDTLLKLPEVN